MSLPRWVIRPSLTFSHCVWLALALTLLMYLPALSTGFWLDDWMQQAVLDGRTPQPGSKPFDLYRFAEGNKASADALRAQGHLPWWAGDSYRLGFWRPLSSALLTLDHQLFGKQAAAYLAHSLLWHCALLLAFAAWLRPTLPTPSAGLAVVLFAVAAAHATTVSWIAARHFLIAGTFSLLAMREHQRGQEFTAMLLLALALAASEAGLAAVCFIAAYNFFGARGRWFRALPALSLALLYVLMHQAQGFGAGGSSQYYDPFADPAAFWLNALPRLLAMFAGLFTSLAPEVVHTGVFGWVWALSNGVFASAALCFGLRWLWPGLPVVETQAIRWLVPAMLACLLMYAGALVGNRMLTMPLVAATVLLAIALRRVHTLALRPSGLAAGRKRVAKIAWFLLMLWLFGSPVVAVVRLYLIRENAEVMRTAAAAAEKITDGDLVIIRTAGRDLGVGWYIAFLRPEGTSTQLLSPSSAALTLTRTSERSLLLDSHGEPWFQFSLANAIRAPNLPFKAGDRISLKGLEVEILAVRGGEPTRAAFHFAQSLDSPALSFATVEDERLLAVTLPQVGGRLQFAEVDD